MMAVTRDGVSTFASTIFQQNKGRGCDVRPRIEQRRSRTPQPLQELGG
ncbi:hypothetical protein LINGRAHAP2_LOCUS31674 [Linum grandiflorum]